MCYKLVFETRATRCFPKSIHDRHHVVGLVKGTSKSYKRLRQYKRLKIKRHKQKRNNIPVAI